MAYKSFTAGEILTAADVNAYLMKQTVMVFASATARNSALTSPTEGMIAYLSDTNALTVYDGASWVGAVNASSLNGFTGVTYADLGITMSTTPNYYTVTIPASKIYTDIVSIIPLGGVNSYVGIDEIFLGPWSGVLGANQVLLNVRLGNTVASNVGTVRFYFRSA